MPTSLDKEHVLAAMTGRCVGFYEQYTTLEKSGSEWRGPCPIHGGDGPNFAVNSETGEWYCHSACGEGGDVFAFLQKKDGLRFGDALLQLADFAGVSNWGRPADRNGTQKPQQLVATYDYVDASGSLLFQVQRKEPGKNGKSKDFFQRRPDGNGGWIFNLEGVSRTLYHLPEVNAAVSAGSPVYLCEGEKDADALRALGVTATCNAGGAGKWEPSYTETLCGAGVVILPDNDPPGRAHAQKAAASLFGKAKRIRVVELPNLPEKGDVSDWLGAEHWPNWYSS